MDVFKPRGASKPRNPTTDQQQNGVITNPPRFAHMGGLAVGSEKVSLMSKT